MAKEIIEIGANTKDAQKQIDDLTQKVKDLGEQVEKAGEGGVGGVGESAKKSTKGVGGLTAGFKSLGLAIKATGIGLLIGLLVSLGDAFTRNEKVARFFSTVMNGISIVVDDFVSFLTDNFGVVVDFFKAIFEDPVGSIKEFGRLIKENLIERFNSMLETVGHVGKAIKKFFEGDFAGAWESAKEAGSEFVDVMTGVDGSVEKIGKAISDGVDAIQEYAKEVANSADELERLERNAKIAAAQQELLNKQYMRDAELQRQIRDDVSKPIQERIDANNKLNDILAKQEQVMLQAANAQLALASKQNELNSNTENYVALIEAQTNQADVLESVNGFKSEQMVNEIGLQQELIDLNKARGEAESQLALDGKKFNAERIQDEEKRLIRLMEIAEEEREIELQRLQSNIDQYKEGTQSRLDAEIEYNQRKQELDQAQIEYEDELNEFRKERELENAEQRKKTILEEEQAKQQAREETFNSLQTLVGEEEKLGKAVLLFKQLQAAKEQLIALGVLKAKAGAVVSEASLDAAGAGKDIAKGTSATAKLGFPQAIPALIAFGATAAGIIGTVTSAVSKTKKVASAIGGTGVSGGSSAPPPPPRSSFNIVGAPSVGNQIAEAIGEQGSQPIRAYVTTNDINDGQSLEQNIVNSATISGD